MDELQRYVTDLPLSALAFFTLVETTARLVEVSEKYWQSAGLNGARIRILVELMKEGGTLLPSRLAQRIGVTKANISLLLTPLENEGLLRRAAHPADGRKSVVTITAEGQRLLLLHLPINRQHIAAKMEALNEQELQQLIGLLRKLKES